MPMRVTLIPIIIAFSNESVFILLEMAIIICYLKCLKCNYYVTCSELKSTYKLLNLHIETNCL